MEEDPILAEKKVLPVTSSPDDYYSIGLKLGEISDKEIDLLSRFVQGLYASAGTVYKINISRDAGSHLKGAIFALGTSQSGDNKDWRGHTASSLREMVYVWNGNCNFFESFKKIDDTYFNALDQAKKDSCEQICKKIKSYYGYFSGITHQDFNSICFKYKELESGAIYTNYEDCIKKEVFVDQVVKFLRDIKVLLDYLNPDVVSTYETN
jgi:hypothetical protein